MPTLISKWTDYKTKGIFSRMNLDFIENSSHMDYIYYLNRSGTKEISPIVQELLEDDGSLKDATKNILAQLIKSFNYTNWLKLYNAMFAEYTPINNYDMTETETTNDYNTIDATNKFDSSKSDNLKTSGNTGNYIYGFNSSEPSQQSSSKISNTDTNTYTENNTNTNNGTNKRDIERTLKRSGNIGVTTSQQMIQSEIELRKQNFYDMIMKDVDKILVLGIY